MQIFKILQEAAPPMPPVREGDWLYHFPESGQTIKQYFEKTEEAPFHEPMGVFVHHRLFDLVSYQWVVDAAVKMLQVFYPFSVKVDARLSNIWETYNAFRPSVGWGTRELADEFLWLVRPRHRVTPKEDDLYRGVHVVLVDVDLFAEDQKLEGWVFGLSDCRSAAVVSLVRFLAGSHRSAENLLRFFKILVHEVGHELRLQHCTKAPCVMNGVISMNELDRHPFELCPYCLEKIHSVKPFDLLQRAQAVREQLTTQGIACGCHRLDDEIALLQKARAQQV